MASRFITAGMALLVGACLHAQETGATVEPANNAASRPSIDSHTVMLYYDDLTEASIFYGEKLGLEKTQDFGWVKFFRLSAGAEVGIVKAGPGAYYAPQPKNAVMLSIVTREVDAWYKRLKPDKAIVFLVDIHTAKTAPIRNFMIRDPGGYTVEFFQWLEKP